MVRRNVQPDTALNWSAVAELAGTGTMMPPVKPTTGNRPLIHPDPLADLLATPLRDLKAPLPVESGVLGETIYLDPNSPWPATLDGLGVKKVGAFRPCLWCGTGSWVRYAGLPTCLTCARSWPETRTQDGARAYLWRLMDTWGSMDESTWQEANVRALYEDIMDLFNAHPEAEAWYREWRATFPEARLA